MTIARNPRKQNKPAGKLHEAKVDRFIRGANGKAALMPLRVRTLKPILINFEESLLIRINTAAVAAGSTRTAWITSVLLDRLTELEK